MIIDSLTHTCRRCDKYIWQIQLCSLVGRLLVDFNRISKVSKLRPLWTVWYTQASWLLEMSEKVVSER